MKKFMYYDVENSNQDNNYENYIYLYPNEPFKNNDFKEFHK